jgi:deoxyhypusine monooxygenase
MSSSHSPEKEAVAENSFKFPPMHVLQSTLMDKSKPIAARMRSIFYLRTIGGDAATTCLMGALEDKEGTTLFRHEIAYVLGQMQAKEALSLLESILQDENDDIIVRHECGEALGAIADSSSLPLLEKFSHSPQIEIAETCQIAHKRVVWMLENSTSAQAKECMGENPFESIDPAPSTKKPSKEEVAAISALLLDPSLPLFDRYKAMFSLRNNGSKAAVVALCKGLLDPSPLFRHEVAYVLGQLSHAASVEALKVAVLNPEEHEMVRHEAAEALGAIGTMECVEFLRNYLDNDTNMLKESCQVALDVVDYWNKEDMKNETNVFQEKVST